MIERIKVVYTLWRRTRKHPHIKWHFNCTVQDCPMTVSSLRFILSGCVCRIHNAIDIANS